MKHKDKVNQEVMLLLWLAGSILRDTTQLWRIFQAEKWNAHLWFTRDCTFVHTLIYKPSVVPTIQPGDLDSVIY